MKRLVGLAGLILLSITATLALCEAVVRFSSLSPSRENLRSIHELRLDEPWLFRMVPGSDVIGPGGSRYRVNSDGFRDRDYARPKPPGTFRILLLGHSVGFGWAVEVEDTYADLLEAELARLAPDARIEVLNLSVCAYNAYNEAALFADIGASYEPDLVIVEFGINDLNDPTLHFDGQMTLALSSIPDAAFPDPTKRLPDPPPPSWPRRACKLSEFCTLLMDRIAPVPLDAAWLRASAGPREEHSEREMTWLRAQYGKIAADASGAGAKFAILILPYVNQVMGDATAQVQQRVEEMGREAGWETVDILPAFRAAAPAGEPLFLDLWHFTPRGHRIAVDSILSQLCCRGLLPLPRERCCKDTGASTRDAASAAPEGERDHAGPS